MLLWVGRLAGIAGALLCVLAGVVRISGHFWLGNFQLGTLLLAGIAIMVAGCVCLLLVLADRASERP
jgi:hypothetical protein